jgi:hypothetical protein
VANSSRNTGRADVSGRWRRKKVDMGICPGI